MRLGFRVFFKALTFNFAFVCLAFVCLPLAGPVVVLAVLVEIAGWRVRGRFCGILLSSCGLSDLFFEVDGPGSRGSLKHVLRSLWELVPSVPDGSAGSGVRFAETCAPGLCIRERALTTRSCGKMRRGQEKTMGLTSQLSGTPVS